MSTALISLAAATVRFGAVQALREVDLELRRGDRLALIGANGCGKTTLLRLLHGLLAPGSGERRLHEVPASPGAQAAPGRPPVQAMLFQRPFLLHLSVNLNLRLALWLAGVPRAQWNERCAAALARVALQGLEERPARAHSGGQQQRLAIARAWAVQPTLLFLDEPTASLDPTAKKEVEALLAGFAADGMTLVMSTHNLGQAKRLASRVVYLEDGEIHADLPTAQFFDGALQGRARQFVKGEMA